MLQKTAAAPFRGCTCAPHVGDSAAADGRKVEIDLCSSDDDEAAGRAITTTKTTATPMPRAPAVPPPPVASEATRAPPAASWEVRLEGQFRPYDAATQVLLEAAYQRGETRTTCILKGVAYEITLVGERTQSRSDGSRTRDVRRRVEAAARV